MRKKGIIFLCLGLTFLFLLSSFGLSFAEEVKDKGEQETKTITFHVIGKGSAPENTASNKQIILLGQSAAISDGLIRLIEKIEQVYLDSYKKSDKIVDNVLMYTEIKAWLKNVKTLGVEELENSVFQVRMSVSIKVNKGDPLYVLNSDQYILRKE